MLAGFLVTPLAGQHIFTILTKDAESKLAMPGVNVSLDNVQRITDSSGVIQIQQVATGSFTVSISYVGYKSVKQVLQIPAVSDTLVIFLEREEEEMEELIVQSTRTSRTITNTPTRVETIDGEELDEKSNMRPANVSMLLHESTGMQVQQTSATSGNASIRVQGLDGRYTQLLKDGYPNFGGFAGGLSILEIPPLDLKQVEVIKGPASTLYGGGAIAGVVNFISKLPSEKFNADLMVNRSNIGQTNVAAFLSHKKGKIGYSLLGAINAQSVYDVDGDDFTEIPEGNNFTIHPRLFFNVNPSTSILLGNSFTKGEIKGGDVQVVKGNGSNEHTYFETNRTVRNTSTLELDKKSGANNTIKIKQSLSIFNRYVAIPGYEFEGTNANSFTDASFLFFKNKHTAIAGVNIVYDHFNQKNSGSLNARSFTSGIYLQDTWDATEKVKIESGIRVDNVSYKTVNYSRNQTFVLPRVSVLFFAGTKISSRVSGGLGYKIPTVFTEQTEAIQYRNLLALNDVTAEKSLGLTADVNFRTMLTDELQFSINQMFFYTRISRPLVLEANTIGNYFFSNAAQPVVSSGFETNIKLIFKKDLKLFAGFTYTDARAKYKTGNQLLALQPRNKLNLALMYEKEENFKLGLEGYHTGMQYLTNGNATPRFWEFGFMAQKTCGIVSLFINFENFTDQRQSKYKGVANPPHNMPTFDDIWNHTEGFVWNGGIKIKM